MAGGRFLNAGGVSGADHLARYQWSWSTLGTGRINGLVYARNAAAPESPDWEEMVRQMRQLRFDDPKLVEILAESLARLPGIRLDPAKVRTNIVIFDVSGTGLASGEISARLKARGVLINGISATAMRLVTHMDAGRADCERALGVIEGDTVIWFWVGPHAEYEAMLRKAGVELGKGRPLPDIIAGMRWAAGLSVAHVGF